MRTRIALLSSMMLVSCTFDLETCKTDGDCGGGGNCTDGFCVAASSSGGGSGGGTATGGGDGSGGGTGTGGGTAAGGGTGDAGAYCDVSCAEWQECVADVDGGTCADYVLSWLTPDAGVITNATSMLAQLSLLRRDGGSVLSGLLPVLTAPAAAGATLQSSTSPFQVLLSLPGTDGPATFTAGWADGGVPVPLTIVVDRSGPTFTIASVGSDAGALAGGADFLTTDPSLDGGAYRKDEKIRVRVTAAATDVGSVQVSARYGSAAQLIVSSSTNCGTGSGFCGDFEVDLSQLSLPAFSGPVVLTAWGADTLGNMGQSDTDTIQVTRWNWARQIGAVGGLLKSTPAIGVGGRVFVGRANLDGGVVAVNPDGTVAWQVTDNYVDGPIAVGRGTGTSEFVFVLPQGGFSKAIVASSGVATASFQSAPPDPNTGASNSGGIALLDEGTGSIGSIGLQPASDILTSNRGFVMRNGSNQSTALGGNTGVSAPGNMVVGSYGASFVTSGGKLRLLELDGGNIYNTTLDQAVGGVGVVNGLAMLSGTRIAGGGGGPGVGGLFAFDFAQNCSVGCTYSATSAWTTTSLSNPTSGPSVGAGGLFAQYRDSNDDSSIVLRINPSTGAEIARSANLASSVFDGNGVGTPALGANNKVYVVDARGSLYVLPQDFTGGASADWHALLPSAVGSSIVVSASPALDCNRRRPSDNTTGVIYIATEGGWLVSYLIDSQGLDTAAPWPKYARDARNTGNFNGPTIACP